MALNKKLLLLLPAFFTLGVMAQVVIKSSTDSTLVIKSESRYKDLIERQKKLNLANPAMAGYRIQIYFGGNRQKATEVKLDFSGRYPNLSSYLTYQQPNFKVRVGDFRSRNEAQKTLNEITGIYPTSFIVPDEVKLPPVSK